MCSVLQIFSLPLSILVLLAPLLCYSGSSLFDSWSIRFTCVLMFYCSNSKSAIRCSQQPADRICSLSFFLFSSFTSSRVTEEREPVTGRKERHRGWRGKRVFFTLSLSQVLLLHGPRVRRCLLISSADQ